MYYKFSHPSGQCSRVAATCYALRADGQYMFALGNPGTQVKGTRGKIVPLTGPTGLLYRSLRYPIKYAKIDPNKPTGRFPC